MVARATGYTLQHTLYNYYQQPFNHNWDGTRRLCDTSGRHLTLPLRTGAPTSFTTTTPTHLPLLWRRRRTYCDDHYYCYYYGRPGTRYLARLHTTAGPTPCTRSYACATALGTVPTTTTTTTRGIDAPTPLPSLLMHRLRTLANPLLRRPYYDYHHRRTCHSPQATNCC